MRLAAAHAADVDRLRTAEHVHGIGKLLEPVLGDREGWAEGRPGELCQGDTAAIATQAQALKLGESAPRLAKTAAAKEANLVTHNRPAMWGRHFEKDLHLFAGGSLAARPPHTTNPAPQCARVLLTVRLSDPCRRLFGMVAAAAWTLSENVLPNAARTIRARPSKDRLRGFLALQAGPVLGGVLLAETVDAPSPRE
jgi:hypothetical protein